MRYAPILLVSLLLAGCATLGRAAPPFPFTSVTEFLAASGVSVNQAMCPGGAAVALATIDRPGTDLLDYRLLVAPATRRFILMDFSASSEDRGLWVIYFGTTDADTRFVVTERLSAEEAAVKYPSPCDFLAPLAA